MVRGSSRFPLSRRWHARIEHYTPDGALGRWLLGSLVGAGGLWILALALFDPTVPAGLSVAFLGVAAPTLLFAGLVLWPVYLSLIGTLESTEEYAIDRAGISGGDSNRRSNGDGGEEPLDDLKRRYADGEMDETEFEQRLEHLLDANSSDRSSDGNADRTDASTGLDGDGDEYEYERGRERE